MTLIAPLITPIIPAVLPPVSNITPFTYRDGWTFLDVLENMRRWLNDVVRPELDANFQQVIDELNAALSAQIEYVNGEIADLTEYVDVSIADLTTFVNGEITDVNEAMAALTVYINEAVASIIEDSIQVQDPVVAGIVNDIDSLSRVALDAIYKVYTDTRVATVVQVNERALTPYRFGAVPPIAGSDNTAAITAMFAAATAGGTNGGAEIYFPPGLWRYSAATALPLLSGLKIRGAGRGRSRLSSIGTSSLFEWNTNIFGLHIEDISLECMVAGKGIFSPQASGGIYGSTFNNCFWNSGADTSWIWKQNNGASFIHLTFQDVEMQRTVGSTVVPFSVITTGAAANFNKLDNVRFNGSVNQQTPFMHVETTLAGTYLTDWVIINLLGEQNPWGLLRVLGANNWTLINCTDEDSTVDYGGNLFDFQASAAGVNPENLTFISCGRRGRAMVATFFDFSFAGNTKNLTMINCNPSTTSQQSLIKLPNGNAQVLGTRGQPSIKLGTLPPNGNYNGLPGDVFINTGGGAGTTLWVKETGTATATGWVGK